MSHFFKITAIQVIALFFLPLVQAAGIEKYACKELPDSSRAEHLAGAQILAEAEQEILPGKSIGKKQLRSCWNLAEAIRHFSGLQLKDYGNAGGLKTVNIRSLGSEHTGVYIDGVSIDNAQNMQVDLGRFSADSYDQVEVFNGQRSLRLQSAKEYANSNALYLSSSAPLFTNGQNDRFRFRLKGGASSTGILAANWEHQSRCGLRLRTNMDMTSTSGKYPFTLTLRQTYPDGQTIQSDTTLIRQNGDLLSGRLETSLFGSNWKIQTYSYASERGLPGPVIRRTASNPTGHDRQTDASAFIQGSWHLRNLHWGKFPMSLSLKGKLSYDYIRYRTQPAIDPGAQPYDNRYQQTALYLSYAQLLALSEKWGLNLSADGQYNYLDANLPDFVYPHRFSLWAVAATSYHSERWKLSASLLYHIFRDHMKKQTNGFLLHSRTRQCLSPFLLASWSIFPERWEIHAFAKRASRMPTFNDLYYTLIGNSNLQPEHTLQIDLGTNGTISLSPSFRLETSLDFYANRIQDKIIATPTSNQFRWSMSNLGKVRIKGMDLDIKLDCRHRPSGIEAFAAVQYTYQEALNYSSPEEITYKNQIPYIPRHSGSLSGNLLYRGWELSTTWFASSRRWSTSANLPTYEIKAWNTLDCDLSRTFPLKRMRRQDSAIRLMLSFRNILNDQYEIVDGYPMPGFQVMVTMEITL